MYVYSIALTYSMILARFNWKTYIHTVYCCFTYIEPTNIEERTSPLLLLFAGGYRGTLFDTVCSTMLYIPYPVSNYPIITQSTNVLQSVIGIQCPPLAFIYIITAQHLCLFFFFFFVLFVFSSLFFLPPPKKKNQKSALFPPWEFSIHFFFSYFFFFFSFGLGERGGDVAFARQYIYIPT